MTARGARRAAEKGVNVRGMLRGLATISCIHLYKRSIELALWQRFARQMLSHGGGA